MFVQAFFNYLKFEKRYSQNTLKSYHNDISQFIAFCEESDTKPLSVNHKFIRTWIIALIDNHISPRSVNRKLSALKSFYRFLLKENLISSNPLDKVLKPKTSKELPSFVKESEMTALLDGNIFQDDFEGIRDRLIMELFYSTGIRLSELINIRSRDIDRNGKSLKVLGKRNKERIIPLHNNLLDLLNKYQDIRLQVVSGKADSYLFLTLKGEKLYPKLVYRLVNRYLTLVSTIEKRSPHVLRHTFATHMLNNGADLNAIKELLGHANLAATQVYTHNTFEKLKSIYNQAHPRA